MTDCILHKYTETSARAKITRHRERSDDSQVMRYHEDCGSWHVGQIVEDRRGGADGREASAVSTESGPNRQLRSGTFAAGSTNTPTTPSGRYPTATATPENVDSPTPGGDT